MPDTRTDGQLVLAVLAGDRRSFGELVARHRQSVLAVTVRRLGDVEASLDATQDAFVKAYTSLGDLREPARFGSWLSRIADRAALRVARMPRRETSLTSVPAHELPAAGPTPQEWVERADSAARVREHLSSLAEPTRRAVILHHIDGYSQAEVAARLGLTPSAVKTRLSRARRRLRIRSRSRWRPTAS